MEAEVTIRAGTPEDAERVLQIQKASPGVAGWSRRDYEKFLEEERHVFLVAVGQEPIGFLTGRLAADELEILNVAVVPTHRGRGVAARLLRGALDQACEQRARSAWLEVRDSNQAARRLYCSFGFREAYRRPGFYRDPVEDAVVYRRALEPPAA